MKLALTFILYVWSLSSVQAQTPSNPEPPIIRDPVKIDEYGRIAWSDEKARLDNAAIYLQREPANFVLYLVGHDGRRACIGEIKARVLRAKNHPVDKRGILSSRVVSIDGGYRDEQMVEIWLLPRDIGEPYPVPTIDKSEVQLKDCRAKNKGLGKRGGS